MEEWFNEKILILVKTYPVPSKSYRELVCVAGITEHHEWRRLYPIQFRDLPPSKRFTKYSWVNFKVRRRKKDNRPESYQPDLDSVEIVGRVDTKNHWLVRRSYVKPLGVSTVRELAQNRSSGGASLGVVEPTEIIDIEVKPVEGQWSERDAGKLSQLDLENPTARELRKIPFEFRLVFRCKDDLTPRTAIITDWELGALFWNINKTRDRRDAAEAVRERYLELLDKSKYASHLFMGTTLPYDRWIVVGLFYPPKLNQPELL